MALLHKLLIANRGEIALRIIRSAKKLGILTVAIYTESEREAHFVRMSDESVALGKDDLETTFLDIGRMVGIALSTGCDSVHPGYGFLSENPEFALACTRNGLIFVGPDPEVLRLMGNKMAAKELAAGLDIPVAQSHRIELQSLQVLEDISYPVMIKACFGGGGKGMKIVGNRSNRIACSTLTFSSDVPFSFAASCATLSVLARLNKNLSHQFIHIWLAKVVEGLLQVGMP